MTLLTRHARRDPDLHPEPLDDAGLSLRDAALAHAIVDQAVRRWGTIEHVLGVLMSRPFGEHAPVVRAALLAGGAQLLFFDRLPAHAIVDETVGWTRARLGAKSAGLVNAVLRRLASLVVQEADAPARRERWDNLRDELPLPDGGARPLTEPILPEDALDRLAAATGRPAGLLRELMKNRSFDEVRRFAHHGVARAPVILNTAFAREPLPEQHMEPHSLPGHHVFTGSATALTELLVVRRDIWAQDPTSSAATLLAVGLSPRVIVDVCAGRGTKTRQLRELFPDARLIATDTNDARRAELARVFQGDNTTEIIEPRRLIEHVGVADLVLLDVPCSNSGVLARRVEAARRWSAASVGSLLDVQRQIMADSIRLLAPGAAILYTTCSVDRRENEDQVKWLERWHNLRVARAELRWPEGGPGAPAGAWRDGGFAALCR